MRWALIGLALGVGGCARDLSMPPAPGVGGEDIDIDIGSGTPCFAFDSTAVQVLNEERVRVSVSNNCGDIDDVRDVLNLDDPYEAFGIDMGERAFREPETREVVLWLVSQEPGTHEAQLLVGFEGNQTAIQVFGERQ